MSKIKICGLTRVADIHFANEAMPDYVGFVFAKSKRQISFGQAAVLKTHLHKGIQAVGVFVNDDMDLIKRLCDENVIELVQLHGEEDEGYISQLRKVVNVPIIKAQRMASSTLVTNVSADYVLFDTYHRGHYGGTGKCFDWTLIKNCTKPFFLAGGIDIDNIKLAVETLQPYCIDTSSGVETNGVKDKEKMSAIVKLVRHLS